MTSSPPEFAYVDYSPRKGVGEVAVIARRSCKAGSGGILICLRKEFEAKLIYLSSSHCL
jgi:hypothetical protein